MSEPAGLFAATVDDRAALRSRFLAVRQRTDALTALLSSEDQLLQAFADTSPAKWHRAHTSWFFENFVLASHDDDRSFLWNSYYDAVGPRHPRHQRGLLSRPANEEVTRWRGEVDRRVVSLIDSADAAAFDAVAPVVALGCQHEEQHQELILTDILAAFVLNPTGPALRAPPPTTPMTQAPRSVTEIEFPGGLIETGFQGLGFSFDNEHPRHKVFVQPFALSTRAVTVREVRAFVDAGGYATPSLWLSAGFAFVQQHRLQHPHMMKIEDGVWLGFGVSGWRLVDDDEPAAFLSFYEAEAIARFLGGRLPTEAEWEHACASSLDFDDGVFFDDVASSPLRPMPATRAGLTQMGGDVWEWTSSAYAGYPGFATASGALGEYNGKFMIGQQVLRGGSAFTPVGHARPSYRNFWPPETRFQMSGLRIARDR